MNAKSSSIGQVHRLAVRVEEAAEMLGLGRSTVFELLKDGSLASIKVGKRRLIPIQEITAFIGRLASPKKG